MANVCAFPRHEGADIVVTILKAIRYNRGMPAAMAVAAEMVVAASSIIAREDGPAHALDVLATAGAVLPERREAL